LIFMPILAPEPALFPDNLLEEELPTDLEGRRWWALQTRPRQEKSLARDLLDRQVCFYLPLLDQKTIIRRRVFTSQVPLFPGYVFLLGDEQERLTALTTRRVVRPLAVGDQARLWRDLRQLRRLLLSGEPVTPEQRLLPGMLVEIITGPLAGLQGKVLRLDSHRRFVVGVEFMQQGVSVLLDDCTQVRVIHEEDRTAPPRPCFAR
jgi:transcriptional antiterminator RfaH